jgi:hypothetical protein
MNNKRTNESLCNRHCNKRAMSWSDDQSPAAATFLRTWGHRRRDAPQAGSTLAFVSPPGPLVSQNARSHRTEVVGMSPTFDAGEGKHVGPTRLSWVIRMLTLSLIHRFLRGEGTG